jgi:DNA-binding NarL/FixJ family response regulator
MQEDRRVSVIVLYTHPLFGEGIAQMLASEPGVEVTPLAASDPQQAERLLALAPDVVIFERGDPDMATDVLRYAPSALVIDVSLSPGPTFTYQRHEVQAQPDVILDAVRGIRVPDAIPSGRVRGTAPAGR